jgi:hypothetical protein
MELKAISFRELSQIEYELSIGVGPTTESQILVVSFTGTCGIGSAGNDDATFMRAIIVAALDAWSPSGLVLDLRHLAYEWGDLMTGVLCGGDRYCAVPVLPAAVVVSDLCREGLTSLVEHEIMGDSAHWLFEDLESAIEEVERQIRADEEREDRPEIE